MTERPPVLDLINAAEKAAWRGHFEAERHKNHGKPGEFLASLPPEIQENLKKLTSDDARNVRPDLLEILLSQHFNCPGCRGTNE